MSLPQLEVKPVPFHVDEGTFTTAYCVAATFAPGTDNAATFLDERKFAYAAWAKERMIELAAQFDCTIKEEEQQDMDPYYITEENLGQWATRADAELMVKLLREHGHNVLYGEPMQRNPDPPFNDAEWQECLDLLDKM